MAKEGATGPVCWRRLVISTAVVQPTSLVPSRLHITASAAARGGRTYEVQKGDTLFDIARYELGQASRWIDIYKLNQHLLTDDFNFIKPGMKLILPERRAPSNVQQERFTQQQELVPLR